MNFLTIHESLSPFPGIETFIPADFIHNSQKQFGTTAQSDAYTIRSLIVNIIRSSVQWINDPAVRFVLISSRAFFRNKSCFGQQGRKCFYQPYFRLFIHIRHIIMRMFFHNTLTTEVFPLFFQKMPGFGSYAAYFNCKLL